ncbi:3-phosphoshikimate 1-carboxyvinyltransferase [Sphingobacteriaceae bacterium WQ 2009]|uniref:3-phosphoshikimate 1-carboxyvinyltransferase n=1 Tax=Rhinopithecimicrobium faecis TaxID=2820698 RepID=A0A8T4HAI0_9SPHI|nr:3-phosphoshikimate 1-carboxyvinyltransferase [Sphingobacteriaceae bacterium WQ 2009]
MKQASIQLTHISKKINGTVQLTGSKSESNRALIIQALSQGRVSIENLSEAADTVTLEKALQQAQAAVSNTATQTNTATSDQQDNATPVWNTIDIGPAGTAMRFLTSYLNLVPANFILTGSERMQQRPIGILVDALKTLGAAIQYEDKNGYPPLKIEGGFLQGQNNIPIQGNISSQYISSLLLVASSLEKGLTLTIAGELTSKPYVSMTLAMLNEVGIASSWSGDEITIAPQVPSKSTLFVEPDWSAASYWYAIVALSDNGHIVLPGLKRHSLQGDMAIVDIMQHFGVASSFQEDGLHLTRVDAATDKKEFDFKECPDLAQTVVVVAAARKQDITLTGLETLKIKETNRIAALQNEIGKFGAKLIEENQVYYLKTADVYAPESISIQTYEDHRMAMAFAPLALCFQSITIEEPQVVEKSYPDFWKHLQSQGFKIN